MFTVIESNGYEKDKCETDYATIYSKTYIRAVERYFKAETRQNLYKVVYHGVKCCHHLYRTLDKTDPNYGVFIQALFQSMEAVKVYIKRLTPNELMRLFPVDKRYDGERWEAKDYFFTMGVLKEHGLDTPIGDAVDNILWDYTNHDLMWFILNLMDIVGELHKAQTGRDMLLDFFEEQGVHLTTYTRDTDPQTGKQYMINNDTGEIARVYKPMPRYMKVIQGGACI